MKFSCAFSGGTPKPRSHRLPVGPRLGRLDHLQPILPALELLRQLRAHPIRTMLGVLRRIGGCRLAQQLAIQQVEKLHPGYGSYVEYGVSIPWARMNNMLGCEAAWTVALRSQWFKLLQAPSGNHYIIGDQMSYLPGWQERAMYSAFHALADIDRRERQTARSAAA